jgi:hypothetical protein
MLPEAQDLVPGRRTEQDHGTVAVAGAAECAHDGMVLGSSGGYVLVLFCVFALRLVEVGEEIAAGSARVAHCGEFAPTGGEAPAPRHGRDGPGVRPHRVPALGASAHGGGGLHGAHLPGHQGPRHRLLLAPHQHVHAHHTLRPARLRHGALRRPLAPHAARLRERAPHPEAPAEHRPRPERGESARAQDRGDCRRARAGGRLAGNVHGLVPERDHPHDHRQPGRALA